MYTCGPTVYSFAHIGNFRTYTAADFLLRVLQYNNLNVQYIMNLTDVGHLTGDNQGDADLGEDRMEKAAKKEGFVLPYSCEAGRCGNCAARCTKGSVWHSYNEVLTEKELSQGLVLTCVGHPNGDDIELEI